VQYANKNTKLRGICGRCFWSVKQLLNSAKLKLKNGT